MRRRRLRGSSECEECGGDGYVTDIERSPGSPDGYRERSTPCRCAREPEYDGPPDDDRDYDGPAVDDWFRGGE
jgi:hypothetical protein